MKSKTNCNQLINQSKNQSISNINKLYNKTHRCALAVLVIRFSFCFLNASGYRSKLERVRASEIVEERSEICISKVPFTAG